MSWGAAPHYISQQREVDRHITGSSVDKPPATQSDGNEFDASHGHDIDFNISIPVDDIYLEYLSKHVTMFKFGAK